jgi:hypothetical protein
MMCGGATPGVIGGTTKLVHPSALVIRVGQRPRNFRPPAIRQRRKEVRVTTAQEFAAPASTAPESTAPEPMSPEPMSPESLIPTVQAGPGSVSTAEHHERTVASVLETLYQQFPQADPGPVKALVDQGFAEFAGARVTTYVPVLVLRACQEQLRGA